MKLLLLLGFASLCAAHICPSRHYWSESLDRCLECKTCHITVLPCTKNKNTLCAKPSVVNHHFLRNRIHFFDKENQEEENEQMNAKNAISTDEIYFPLDKEQHKKNIKHQKPKHNEKHHKAKKHFEFFDDDDEDSYDDILDDDYVDFERLEKPKKHKKHYEFNKHEKKYDDIFSSDEYDTGKHHSNLGKGLKKDNHKVTHLKKVDSDEEKLEEWLIQSKKKLKLRKDNLLKTLKEESVEHDNAKKTIRLNSPIYESENFDSDEKMTKKINSHATESDVNLLSGLSKEENKLEPLMENKKESYRPGKPFQRLYLGAPVSGADGRYNRPQDIIRHEMGRDSVFEKPLISVIPFVTSIEEQEQEPHAAGTGGDVVSLPFSAAETLVWDWQAVAVVSAVVSCLVFFTVIAIYFVVNARQWKKVNKTYNKDIEEMSTRKALIHPTMESLNSECHTTSLYLENIANGKEDTHKLNE